MHGKILQISRTPIERDEHITLDDISEYWMQRIGADYLANLDGKDKKDAISWALRSLPKGMFTVDRRKHTITFTGNADTFKAWFRTIQERFAAIDPDKKDAASKMACIRLDLDDMGRDLWFHFDDWAGGVIPAARFYQELLSGELEDRTFHYGGIVDYHC